MTRPTPTLIELDSTDRAKVLRAVDWVQRGPVALLANDNGEWFVYDLTKSLSIARIKIWTSKNPNLLVGIYVLGVLSLDEIQKLMMEDLVDVGAI